MYDNKTLKKITEKQLHTLGSNFPFIDESVIVSSDGYVVSRYPLSSVSIERVGTMGSSMISLADTMTAELDMGKCMNLVIENETGLAIIIHINADLNIITVTRESSKLGMLLSVTKCYAEKIRKSIS